jgi:hypothetical protein
MVKEGNRGAERSASCVQQILEQNGHHLVPLAIGNLNAIRSDVTGPDRFDQGLPGRYFGCLAGGGQARKLLPLRIWQKHVTG